MQLEYKKKKEDGYQTIYDVLKQEWELSNRLLLKVKKEDHIQLNSKPARTWFPLHIGDTICVTLDFEEITETIVPTPMPLTILYEDEAFLILDKPAGIPVHPSMQHYENSLANGVQHYYQTSGIKSKMHPINRLDKNTSGIVLFAKNEYIQEACIRQMKQGTFQKEYLAICHGHPKTSNRYNTSTYSQKRGKHHRTRSEFPNRSECHYALSSRKTILSTK